MSAKMCDKTVWKWIVESLFFDELMNQEWVSDN